MAVSDEPSLAIADEECKLTDERRTTVKRIGWGESDADEALVLACVGKHSKFPRPRDMIATWIIASQSCCIEFAVRRARFPMILTLAGCARDRHPHFRNRPRSLSGQSGWFDCGRRAERQMVDLLAGHSGDSSHVQTPAPPHERATAVFAPRSPALSRDTEPG